MPKSGKKRKRRGESANKFQCPERDSCSCKSSLPLLASCPRQTTRCTSPGGDHGRVPNAGAGVRGGPTVQAATKYPFARMRDHNVSQVTIQKGEKVGPTPWPFQNIRPHLHKLHDTTFCSTVHGPTRPDPQPVGPARPHLISLMSSHHHNSMPSFLFLS